jgi:hypothetical protein
VANTLGRELPSFEVTERPLTPDGRLLDGPVLGDPLLGGWVDHRGPRSLLASGS